MSDIEAITFEAQLWAVRHSITKKEEKTVITLHCHPNDAEALMNINLLNRRFQVAMAAIGDDERPQDLGGVDERMKSPDIGKPEAKADTQARGFESRPRRKFSDLPRSQQAALLGDDPRFQKWLGVKDRIEARAAILGHCHMDSRKALDQEGDCFVKDQWDALVEAYQTDTGRAAEIRG